MPLHIVGKKQQGLDLTLCWSIQNLKGFAHGHVKTSHISADVPYSDAWLDGLTFVPLLFGMKM